MNSNSKRIGAVVLVLCLATGYGYYTYQQNQAILWGQLQDLDDTLSNLNAQRGHTVDAEVKEIEQTVRHNFNQPREVKTLQQAQEVARLAHELQVTTEALREQLLQQTNNAHLEYLRHPTAGVNVLALHSNHEPTLSAQFDAYSTYVRGLYPPDSLTHSAHRAALPSLGHYFSPDMSVGLALAALSQLNSDVLDAEAGALRLLKQTLGLRSIPRSLAAVATAESNVVAPGATYKARLSVINILNGQGTGMSCDGKPVHVAKNGVGVVSFRAPMQPGAAAWQGTVKLMFGGRDTTFRVRVPYQVVRR